MKATAPAPGIAERGRVLAAFLEADADALAHACLALARAFAQGGTLICSGTGSAASDAAHVAVEFMHPVIVGKRALPALALGNDPARAGALATLARPGDIALVLSHGGDEVVAGAFLDEARRRGMLTLAFSAGARLEADHAFAVPTGDPVLAQEVQETGYHVLWELVHVFFEHPGLLHEACITCGDVAVEAEVVEVGATRAVVTRGGAREEVAVDLIADVRVGDRLLCHAGVALERTGRAEDTGFLYTFLDQPDDDQAAVLADVAASARLKGAATTALRATIDVGAVATAGRAVRAALDGGGRLLCFGNGGSATDAQDLAADAGARGWPAVALVNDPSTITAVANDVGFENVFARQLIALGRPGDVAIALSTSGSSPHVIAALAEARRRELVTVAIVGYGGGRLRGADHVLLVEGDYVPRLQEAHATISHLLLEAVG